MSMVSKQVHLNMRLLRPSRPNLKPGDVFAFLMPDGLYRFGRVIRTDATIGRLPNSILIYVYRCTSSAQAPLPMLSPSDLLIPPCGTNRQAWLKGYFENVAHVPLVSQDVLPVHCFWDMVYQCHRDDDGNRLPKKSEPCGDYGLHSYRTIDDAISQALGIPLAPD